MTLVPSADVAAEMKLGAVESPLSPSSLKLPATGTGSASFALETINSAGLLMDELFSLAKSNRCCSCSLSSIQSVIFACPASIASCNASVTSKLTY